jgi:hypothetical protein
MMNQERITRRPAQGGIVKAKNLAHEIEEEKRRRGSHITAVGHHSGSTYSSAMR